MSRPEVSIVVPHYRGPIILDCLKSVYDNTEGSFELIVVDDGGDGSVEEAKERFPEIKLILNPGNLGFAASCNRGMEVARGRYFVLLNNDVEVSPGWLRALVEFAESHPSAGACQPKIISFSDRRRFDYAGAAGGLMDMLGYPYCLGRVFHTLEEDEGQYDSPRRIFWASGTALFLRREAVEDVGGLDEGFFMHMEEIDLCWRLHRAGWEVWSVPEAVVYHRSGWSLPQSFRKMYLNHRNNLVLLLKNYDVPSLLSLFPLRVLLEVLTVLRAPFGEPGRSLAALLGMLWVGSHPMDVIRRRREAWRARRVPDALVRRKLSGGSILFWYGIYRRKGAPLPCARGLSSG